jgi:hypothetical protein
MKCCVNIYFYRQCLTRNLPPNYSKIKIPNTSLTSRFTKQKIVKLRIKDEIKFLYIKKNINYSELYDCQWDPMTLTNNTLYTPAF